MQSLSNVFVVFDGTITNKKFLKAHILPTFPFYNYERYSLYHFSFPLQILQAL